MDELIEALQIFRKYVDGEWYSPTHCEHDIWVSCPPEDCKMIPSSEDRKRLRELGFHYGKPFDEGAWHSYRYGSA